jgi:TetR/AcrR family transcriptional regulator, cholesterol catabolism regulator
MKPMPRPNRKAERRLAILDAARHVAVRAIATAAGMEPSAVLYYFSGLNDIVRELVYAASDRFIETITAAVAEAESPAGRLDAAIEAGSTGGLEGDESRILYEFWSAGLRDESLNDADHALDRRQVAIYLGILEDGVAAGVFHPRIDAAEVAWALVALEDGLVMDILAGTKTHGEVTRLIRSVAEALLDVTLPG